MGHLPPQQRPVASKLLSPTRSAGQGTTHIALQLPRRPNLWVAAPPKFHCSSAGGGHHRVCCITTSAAGEICRSQLHYITAVQGKIPGDATTRYIAASPAADEMCGVAEPAASLQDHEHITQDAVPACYIAASPGGRRDARGRSSSCRFAAPRAPPPGEIHGQPAPACSTATLSAVASLVILAAVRQPATGSQRRLAAPAP